MSCIILQIYITNLLWNAIQKHNPDLLVIAGILFNGIIDFRGTVSFGCSPEQSMPLPVCVTGHTQDDPSHVAATSHSEQMSNAHAKPSPLKPESQLHVYEPCEFRQIALSEQL